MIVTTYNVNGLRGHSTADLLESLAEQRRIIRDKTDTVEWRERAKSRAIAITRELVRRGL